jgi:hypothetical protein
MLNDKKRHPSPYLPASRRKKEEPFCNYYNYWFDPLGGANRDGMLGQDQGFTSLLGISANVCSVGWNICDFPSGTEPIHLLRAFLFLKKNGTEPLLIAIASAPTQKNFQKWV